MSEKSAPEKGKEGEVSQEIAALDKVEDAEDYLKQRSKMAQEEVPEPVVEKPKVVQAAPPPDDTVEPTEPAPVKAGEDPPDPDPEPGEDPNDGTDPESSGKPTATQLPDGVKKRISRANKQRDRARSDVARLEKENADLKAKLEAGNTDPKPPAAEPPAEPTPEPTAADDKPIPEEEYDFDFPEEDDYIKAAGGDKTKGIKAFVEDVKRWEDNLPLKGGKYAGKPAKPAATQEPPKEEEPEPTLIDPPKETDPLLEAEALMWADVQETLDDADDDDFPNLTGDFFSQYENGKFRLSQQMLDYLASNDEDTVILVKKFVQQPKFANRIYRNPVGQHGAKMKKLAASLRKNPSPEEEEPQPSNQGGGVTVVTPLHGRTTPAPAPVDHNEAKDFESYKHARKMVDRAG